MNTEGILTFWECRGSIPAPSGHTVVFGGNTAYVSVEYTEYIVIFDAGEQPTERQYLAQQIFPGTLVAREGLKVPLATYTVPPRSRFASGDNEHVVPPESDTRSGIVNLKR